MALVVQSKDSDSHLISLDGVDTEHNMYHWGNHGGIQNTAEKFQRNFTFFLKADISIW